MQRLIIVSSRLPVSVEKRAGAVAGKTGSWSIRPTSTNAPIAWSHFSRNIDLFQELIGG